MTGTQPVRERRAPARAPERRLVDILVGRMEVLEDTVTQLETKVDKLDGWQQRLLGAIAVLVFLATILGGVAADAIARAIHP